MKRGRDDTPPFFCLYCSQLLSHFGKLARRWSNLSEGFWAGSSKVREKPSFIFFRFPSAYSYLILLNGGLLVLLMCFKVLVRLLPSVFSFIAVCVVAFNFDRGILPWDLLVH